MATHVAPHLDGTGTERRPSRSQVHLLVVAMALTFSMAQPLEIEERKCNKSRDCAYLLGEICNDDKICRCEPPTCNRMFAFPIKCTEDVECAQIISFSHCVHDSCICLPGYRPLAFGGACEFVTPPETTSPNPLWPRPNHSFRPAGETDYSGVVKMALGAAIVMLAGVILALVWNLYRERRRARRALSGQTSTRNRRAPRTNRRQRGGRGNQTDEPEHPPRYDDVFFITASETGRRYDKPPSYEEALRDQQIQIVTPPAYVNLGYNSDNTPCSATNYCQPVPTSSPSTRAQQEQNTADINIATLESGISNTQFLNVSSIINRLKLNRQPTSAANNSGDSAMSIGDDSPVPTCTLRRTKSGRAPDDICPVQCENPVDQISVRRSNSNPIATVRIDQSSSERQCQSRVIGDASINNDSSPGVSQNSELVSVTAHYEQRCDDEASANAGIVIEDKVPESSG